jgi:hypothetical protein
LDAAPCGLARWVWKRLIERVFRSSGPAAARSRSSTSARRSRRAGPAGLERNRGSPSSLSSGKPGLTTLPRPDRAVLHASGLRCRVLQVQAEESRALMGDDARTGRCRSADGCS